MHANRERGVVPRAPVTLPVGGQVSLQSLRFPEKQFHQQKKNETEIKSGESVISQARPSLRA